MSFPKKLAALRKENGLTQQVLANKIDIHVSQLKRYEAWTSQPTLDVLHKIALSLHVSSDVLLFDKGDREPDDDLQLHFEAVSKLDPDEKKTIKELLEGTLLKHEARKVRSLEKHFN
ncbi:MAG: helix-turn-helix transcriptional regulator [Desulfocapsa sp.]|nr:helix-turn-helix transcriptional regulator [Desulfocapsa sp.]